MKIIANKHRPLTLNQHEKICAILKQARNDVERVRKIVARRSDPDDIELRMLEDFWNRFEATRWKLSQRMTREHTRRDIVLADLKRSGLSVADAKRAGYQIPSAASNA